MQAGDLDQTMADTPGPIFQLRSEFHAAVLSVIGASHRELVLADRSFQDWPLESPQGVAALMAFLQGNPKARLRLLVADGTWLQREAPRMSRLRIQRESQIECRQMPPGLFNGEGIALGDRVHLMRRAHFEHFRGRLQLNAPTDANPGITRYEALWEASTPCPGPTALGL
jgi:hypothetical protein